MVIDSHTHIREGNEDIGAFLAGMDEAGVDMAVVSPIAPVELGFHDNKYIAELVKEHPDRIIGYASVHPADLNALDELRAYRRSMHRLRHSHPGAHGAGLFERIEDDLQQFCGYRRVSHSLSRGKADYRPRPSLWH